MNLYELPLDANGHALGVHLNGVVTVFEDSAIGARVFEAHRICAMCGQWPTYTIEDTVVRVVGACPLPNGITTVTDLAVPSGRLIVSDDLRPVYDWRQADRSDPPGMADYNSVMGQHQAITAMARLGCAYGPVGNTCPGLYSTGPDTYVIAAPDYDDDGENPSIPEETRLASICTDLWAYSIADFNHWQSRGGGEVRNGIEIVDVPAGVYRFTYHGGERGFDKYDHDGEKVFAHVERIA